ncbi:hypothetical protein BGZ63DRAFT_53852 [Mariannaea sp. PMI_226]|nr:hypothetical protein BGZ63DRAFT_53852 [Mariannaea sp. PMI_226]
METDPESTSTAPDKPVVVSNDVPKVSKLVLHETIPESPRQPSETETKTNDAPIVYGKPSTPVDEKAEPAQSDPPEPVEATSAGKTAKVSEPPTAVNGKTRPEKTKEPASSTPSKTIASKKPASRPTPISTNKNASKPVVKTPLKTPPNASDKGVSKPTARTHDRPAIKKEATAAKPSPSAPRPTTSTKKPQPLNPSISETGFVKPKVKSPTKPVNLPSSLTAPTASSVSKGANARQGQARPSGNTSTLNVPPRSASRASVSTTTSNGKTVKRQPSSISRSRPSLGPPPKKTAGEPNSKKEAAPVDEGFLARMMRPTQSSSSKTTDKAPLTPPRKVSKQSSTGSEPRFKAPGSAKKQLRRQVESPAHNKGNNTVSADDSNICPVPDIISEPTITTESTGEISEHNQDAEPSSIPETENDHVESLPTEEVTEAEQQAQPETLSEDIEAANEEKVTDSELVDVATEAVEESIIEQPKVEVTMTVSEPITQTETETEHLVVEEVGDAVETETPEQAVEEVPETTESILVDEEKDTAAPAEIQESPQNDTQEVVTSGEVEVKEEKDSIGE